MGCKRFYAQLFAPVEAQLGPIDSETLCAISGFDAGGPLNFCTIKNGADNPFITYVSCELAVRKEQQPCDLGRYELLCACDDEQWVRSIITRIGQESMHTAFGHGHTLDISA